MKGEKGSEAVVVSSIIGHIFKLTDYHKKNRAQLGRRVSISLVTQNSKTL